MEHESKTGGESLRNEEVMDRISELPRDLIIQILSSLSTKDVTATSVLSKNWRSLWKMVPNIKFDFGYAHDKTESNSFFSEIVCKSLLSCSSPVLESLYLVNIYESEASDDIDMWMRIAFARHVRNLVLELQLDDEYEGGLIRFPSVFCSCNNTLGTLELSGRLLLDFPSRVDLNSLKKLHLIYVKFKDEESVCKLLCGCPILEELVVHRRGNCDAETFTIVVPSLQRLTIVDSVLGKVRGGYVINAPSLKCLNITAEEVRWLRLFKRVVINRCGFCLIEYAPELVEAKIIIGYIYIHIHNENILVSLTAAKRLSLDFSTLQIKCPTGINFYHLVSLELNTSKRGWSNLLAYMLDSSPKLQILELIIEAYWYDIKVSDSSWAGEWEQPPKCVPECLLFHLETLVWKRYIWDRKDDKDVATYILKNARRLKKATFYTEPIQYLQTLEEKHEMLNELASVVRASNSCNLVFESSN